MNKLVFSLLGALAISTAALPSVAAPAMAGPMQPAAMLAPVQSATFNPELNDAVVQSVQYRRDGYRGPPRHYRGHRRFARPHHYRGGRGPYRGPPGYARRY